MGKLELKSISIRKAPGFRDGLHATGLDKLAGDINIITGPNGTGKTTIARIIHKLIWPERTVSADIHGAYMVNEEPWTVHLDPTARIVQKDGTDSDPAGIPPKELQKVYMLALHELVGQDDKDLAGRILRESIGGYDLDRASADLKYSGETRNKKSKEYSDFKKISETVAGLTSVHSKLKGDEDNLSQLEERRLAAMKAGELRSLYEKAVQYLIAEEEAAALKTRLDAFPAVLNNIAGDELERIEELEKESEREKSAVEAAGKIIEEEEEKIRKLSLPAGGIDDELLNELDSRISLISGTGKSVRELETEIKRLETEELQTRESINNISDRDEWKGLRLEEAGELDNFFHEALALRQKEIIIRTELEGLDREDADIADNKKITNTEGVVANVWITDDEETAENAEVNVGMETAGNAGISGGTGTAGNAEINAGKGTARDTADADKLRRGIVILGEWLKESRPFAGVPRWVFIILFLAGVLTAAAIYFFGVYGFSGAVLILAILIYGLIRNSDRDVAAKLKLREDDFAKTGLDQPREWEAEQVAARLGELMDELNKLLRAETEEKARQIRLGMLRDKLDSVNDQLGEMNKTREKLLEKLKAMPDFPKSAEESMSALYLFLKGLQKWQSAYTDLLAREESQVSLRKQRNTEVDKCNAIFRDLGVSVIIYGDSDESPAALDDLARSGVTVADPVGSPEDLDDSGRSPEDLDDPGESGVIFTDPGRRDKVFSEADGSNSVTGYVDRSNSVTGYSDTGNSAFRELKTAIADYAVTARALFNTLSAAERKRRDAVREIANQKNRIDYAEERISETYKRIRALYEKLGTEPGSFAEAAGITDQFPAFRDALKNYENASVNLRIRENELKVHPFYEEHEAVLGGISLFEAQARVKELGAAAERLEELNENITRTKTLIEEKKRGAELETALARKMNAGDELEKLYTSNLSSMTGFLLAEHLRKETANLGRPEVMKRADRIFSLITRGRYNLRVSNENGPVFRAVDNVMKLGLGLDELSTGTRVQLLLAARLAFAESIENDVRLPLLADELLANSDDERADAIIEALCGISSEGRQVFYFTAQPDEVEKWLSYLSSRSEIRYRIIQLGGPANGESRYGVHKPAMESVSFVQKIPGPGNRDMNEYRKLLGIRPYDLISDEAAGLSLSFLTGDVKQFHECLERGITTWGQLYAFHEAGGKISGIDEKLIGDMRKKTDLLTFFQKLYRQGRNRPVSIGVIMDSGTVSERFIEEVREKLDEAKGDPLKLVEALDTIRNFRTDKKEQLREYLINEGYIDESGLTDEDDLRLSLQVRAAEQGIDPGDAENFINGLIKFSRSNTYKS